MPGIGHIPRKGLYMNPILLFLLFCCVAGLADKIINKWGLAPYVDKGVAATSACILPYIGICCVGPILIELLFGDATSSTSVAPAVVLGSLLPPDLGGLKLGLRLAPTVEWGLFCGLVLAGCFGQFIGFQLSVLNAAIPDSRDSLIQGFIAGIASAPAGILLGGIILGLPFVELFYSCLPILILCGLLAVGFLMRPHITQKILQYVSSAVLAACVGLFAVAAILLFLYPHLILEALGDSMIAYVRMMIVITGGTVLSGFIAKYVKAGFVERTFRINATSFTGLILNIINSMAMVPLWTQMDTRGKRMNAAFAVSGSYVLGGQLTFATGTGHDMAVYAFMSAKIAAGILGIALILFQERFQRSGGIPN